ncbi:MAG: roadblock/LC7 domain-containing protein [Deltaproteobacteria bacterium]|nr:roadblock/LC7 domain-containing protein [Deltaproteobacteria bacterium]
MAFLEILKDMVEGVGGGVAATIMGMDGLSIQHYASSSDYDVDSVGVEYGKVIDEIKHASTLLNLGEVEEVMVSTHGTDVLLRMVTPEYYIAFVIGHGANAGRARYLLRRATARAKEELK